MTTWKYFPYAWGAWFFLDCSIKFGEKFQSGTQFFHRNHGNLLELILYKSVWKIPWTFKTPCTRNGINYYLSSFLICKINIFARNLFVNKASEKWDLKNFYLGKCKLNLEILPVQMEEIIWRNSVLY